MSITVKPVTPDFVAEISGLDLAQPLKPADRDTVEAAINRCSIVVFHDQKLSDAQQIAFAGNFGPIHSPAQKAQHTGIKHRLAIMPSGAKLYKNSAHTAAISPKIFRTSKKKNGSETANNMTAWTRPTHSWTPNIL